MGFYQPQVDLYKWRKDEKWEEKGKDVFVLSVHTVPNLDILSKNSTYMGSVEFEFWTQFERRFWT